MPIDPLASPDALHTVLAANAQRLIGSAGFSRARSGDRGGGAGGGAGVPDHEAILERLTAAAVASVPGTDYAGLTLQMGDGRLASRAPSHPQIVELDQLQAELGEGPCVDAIADDSTVRVLVEDFTTETRWPRFAPAAVEHGIHGLLCFAMAPREDTPGAINFYSTRPAVFDLTSRTLAAAFATQAAITVYGASTAAHLERALHTRDVIGTAKGILIERFGLDDQQAFDLLVRSSQQTNIKLHEVAHWLVTDTASRPRRPDPPPRS